MGPTIRISDQQLAYYAVNIVLFAVVVLSWTYTILAGKIVSERYLQRLDLSQFYGQEDVTQRSLLELS